METYRLIIREPKFSDLDDMHKLMSSEKEMYYLQDIKSDSVKCTEKNLKQTITQIGADDRQRYFFVIEEKSTGQFVGCAGYTVTDFLECGKLVHLGYFILEKFYNKGYTTEAVKEIIRFAFEKNDVYRISTGCFKDNIASEKIMIKCDMKKEAEFLEYVFHDGKLKDRVEYRLLKSEYFCVNRKGS